MDDVRLGPSPADIQSHVYTSFVQGTTADVAIQVHGTWEAVYNLHRVILIQSDFFRSLFTAGFNETVHEPGCRPEPQKIIVRFEDPNITRAAFEICIAKLYGGGPHLAVSPALIPSAAHPLTSAFPSNRYVLPSTPGHHPATPRFLMSLLATAVYLSIPSLARHALSSILSTIGPCTVIHYLNFANGKHTGNLDFEPGEPEAAVGLEDVAHTVEENNNSPDSFKTIPTASSFQDSQIKKETAHDVRDPTTSSSPLRRPADERPKEPAVHYGGISNKIGESCACWLSRWGADILPHEEKEISSEITTSVLKRSETFLTDPDPTGEGSSQQMHDVRLQRIWSRGGLDARWVRAVISADTFFIKGERGRYDFARRVVELRRKDGVLEAEEQEWVKLFEDGVYYANMTVEDMLHISQDISAITGKPFVSLSVLQRANWSQSVLRSYVTVRPPVTVPPSDPNFLAPFIVRGKDLGITVTTADIFSPANKYPASCYYPVPQDSSIRIGDDPSTTQSNTDSGDMDRLFTSTSNITSMSALSPTLKVVDSTVAFVSSEANFFGLLPARHSVSSVENFDRVGSTRWTPFPPYRFAVEFWDLDFLKEKSRLHSHTVFYAGSLFNIYVQVVQRKEQPQLGVYLHRQSSLEPMPSASAPSNPERLAKTEENDKGANINVIRPLPHRASLSSSPIPNDTTLSDATTQLPATSSRLRTPRNMAASRPVSSPEPLDLLHRAINNMILPATSQPVTPPQPFRDPRPAISAYFSINCASPTGTSQTRFSSSPDVFSVSQSWGWKSSSLMMEGTAETLEENVSSSAGKPVGTSSLVSLRATVVLGLV